MSRTKPNGESNSMQWMRWNGVIMAVGLWACAGDDEAEAGADAGAGGSTGGSIGGTPAGGEPAGGEPAGGAGGAPVGGDPVGGDPVGGEPAGGAGGEPVGGEPAGGAGGEPVGGAGGEPAGGAGGEPVGGAGGAGGEEPPPPPPVPTAEEVQAILDANCNGCHIGGGMSGGIGLDDVTLQIGVAAATAPGINRIEPGDHLSSYLWHKINGTQADVGGGGGRMPLGGVLLPEEIDLIAAWIDSL